MKAVYVGSFDPFTRGHLEVVENMLPVCTNICVLVASNPQKKSASTYSREEMVKLALSKYIATGQVTVKSLPDGVPTVMWAKEHGYTALIRGIRNVKDFEYEKNLKLLNESVCPEVTTVFTITNHAHWSSTNVRELISTNVVPGKVIQEYVQPEVYEYIVAHNLY